MKNSEIAPADRIEESLTLYSNIFSNRIKNYRKVGFHPIVSVLKYHEEWSNSCCLIILASAFHSIGEKKDVTALVNIM